MKITDNENNRWKGNAKRKKITRGTEANSERVRDKWFC